MNLNDLKRLMVFVSGDKGKDISLSPEQFVDLLHLASLKHYKRKIGLPEEYRPGAPIPTQAYELTQRITEDMRRFKVSKSLPINMLTAEGQYAALNYPDDYYIVSSVIYNYIVSGKRYPRKVEVLSDLEFEDRMTSVVESPDLWSPICTMLATIIKLNPASIRYVDITYLRLPEKPYFATTSDKGYLEYDHDQSRQLEWDDINKIDIMVIMLADIGVGVSNADLYQYAEQVKERGV